MTLTTSVVRIMAQNYHSESVFFAYQALNIDKRQPLGRGSYGAVYKAKCDQLPCAAKVLHETIVDPRNKGGGGRMRLERECALIGSIRHPNIVQYLGMNVDPESRLPVLLMELLDESLTKMLEHSQRPLPYCVQVDICHDIALAVVYLHSNEIVHRDLSSNNVLVIAGRRAKVTDYGMYKLAPSASNLTAYPGILPYMAPEALREPPRYTKKLDCFSQGVIMIQVCTRLWPEPGPRTQLVHDSRSPTGTTEMPVLETERRKNHIDLIKRTHPLLPIILNCLTYQEKERPSSKDICQRLAALKEFREYRQSAQHRSFTNGDTQLQEMKRQVQGIKAREAENDRIIGQQREVIQDRDDVIKLQAEKLQKMGQELQLQKGELERKLASQERYIYLLNRKLEEQERVTPDIQTDIQQKPSQQNQLLPSQQQLQQQSSQQKRPRCLPPPLPPKHTEGSRQPSPASVADQKSYPPKTSTQQHSQPRGKSRNYVYLNLQVYTSKKVALTWRDAGRAPLAMVRGDATVNGSEVYFVNYSGEVCLYNSATKRWKTLIKCRYRGSSAAVVNGLLTTIGGFDGVITRSPKSNLLSLSEGTSNTDWVELLPPMPTKRCNTAACTTENQLLVAGGENGTSYMQRLSTVEVMTIETLTWSTVASLPHPYSSASAAICGDDLYILGGLDDNGETKSVLTCSLTELLYSSCGALSVWYQAADSAHYYSTCATVNGELLVVGGCDKEDKATSAVYKYKPGTNSWDLISSMPNARYQCLVAVLPSKEMLVVGGNKLSTPTDIIEITDF